MKTQYSQNKKYISENKYIHSKKKSVYSFFKKKKKEMHLDW